MPSRADLDPDDIAGLLPLTFLIDVRYEPLDFRYRLLDRDVRRSHGDYTGWSLRDLPTPAEPDLDLFEAAVEKLRRTAEIPYLPIPGKFLQAMAAVSEDGRRVNMLFGVMQFDAGEAAGADRRSVPLRPVKPIGTKEVSGWLSPDVGSLEGQELTGRLTATTAVSPGSGLGAHLGWALAFAQGPDRERRGRPGADRPVGEQPVVVPLGHRQVEQRLQQRCTCVAWKRSSPRVTRVTPCCASSSATAR